MAAEDYLRPDGRTLKNLAGATTPSELAEAEAHYVSHRLREWLIDTPVPWTFDEAYLRAIHKHLFQDVFEWAGRTRNERVRLSDGTTAQMPVMMRPGSRPFTHGKEIKRKLSALFADLTAARLLSGLDRDDFADRAADFFARLNSIHPFREGNGRTQRAFIQTLAIAAGHALDFSVVSNERNIEVSIRSRQAGDLDAMRRLFREIADPQRVEALRIAQTTLARNGFDWRATYLATTEPGRIYEDLVMAGKSGPNFMARTASAILIGWRSDLSAPEPMRGETFTIVTADRA